MASVVAGGGVVVGLGAPAGLVPSQGVRLFWVVDGGPSHRGKAAVERLRTAYPNARMIHLPVHASWLNQVQFTRADLRDCSPYSPLPHLLRIRDEG